MLGAGCYSFFRKDFPLHLCNWNFCSPTHRCCHCILNAAQSRDQPTSAWRWRGVVGYIMNKCVLNMVLWFCCPLLVGLQPLRLRMLNLTLSGLMVWKKIFIFMQQSRGSVLCWFVPLSQNPTSFCFRHIGANISWTYAYVLRWKWAVPRLFISFFLN